MRGGEDEVFVEEVEDQLRVSQIVKPTMMHQKPPQELELSKCKVTRLHSTHTFVTEEAYSYVGLLNHRHIISTIADGKGDYFWIVLLDETDDVSFLTRGHSATDDCLTCLANL